MIVRTALPSANGQGGTRPAGVRPDQFSSEGAAFLKSALDQEPAIRPEMLERAHALVGDPDYPSTAVIQHVARQILASPDLSESDT